MNSSSGSPLSFKPADILEHITLHARNYNETVAAAGTAVFSAISKRLHSSQQVQCYHFES